MSNCWYVLIDFFQLWMPFINYWVESSCLYQFFFSSASKKISYLNFSSFMMLLCFIFVSSWVLPCSFWLCTFVILMKLVSLSFLISILVSSSVLLFLIVLYWTLNIRKILTVNSSLFPIKGATLHYNQPYYLPNMFSYLFT